jgi:putative addiction module antidote
MRKSGNSIVVTIPNEIVKELNLEDGDGVFWSYEKTGLLMHIVKLVEIVPEDHFKKEDGQEESTEEMTESGDSQVVEVRNDR